MNAGDSFPYTPYYCEENIWQLAGHPRFEGSPGLVVLISGRGECAFWRQRAAGSPTAPVWWDYHVVLLIDDGAWRVWDLDTTLGLPVDAKRYFSATFLSGGEAVEDCRAVFRVVDKKDYRREFCSDRSHMRTVDGGWLAPPPEWPAIVREAGIPLATWLDMRRTEPGERHDLREIIDRFCDSGHTVG